MSQGQNSKKDTEDVGEALSAVAEALSGKTLSKEDLRNLEEQIRFRC